MHHRVTSVACTLLLGAIAAGGAYAADQSAQAPRDQVACLAQAKPSVHPLTGLGHEGSGLQSRYDATHPKASPPVNPFTGLGHEGSGLQTRYDATHRKANPSEGSGLQPAYDAAKIRAWLS
jgi:hypothetical protein